LPDSIWYPTDYNVITNCGLKLITSTEVTAYTSHLQIFQSEASILYPKEILGTEYILTTASQGDHTYIIVSTENNTIINIATSNDTDQIVLNEGETYQVFSIFDPSGTRITSNENKKIALFSGCRISKMCGSQGGNNHLFEQLFPINLLAQEYAIIPFIEQGPALFKVVATENDTELRLGGQFLTTLNAQESFEFNSEEASILTSNEIIQLSQIACHYDSIGDPSLLHLLPTTKVAYDIFIPSIPGFGSMPETFAKRYLNLITKTANVNDIIVDSNLVDLEFQPIESDSTFSYAHIPISGNVNHIIAPKGVNGYSYGFGNLDAYTFSIGFEKEISTSVLEEFETNCSIYPNPLNDVLKLKCEEIVEFEIFDVLGRLVKKGETEYFGIYDTSNLRKGIFTIRLKSKNNDRMAHVISKKIIKN